MGYVETTPAVAPGMTPMQEALEAALQANPDDLASFMAYADWLSEQDDPSLRARGEFIQVQLALEDEGKPAAQRKKLQKRERELLQAHQDDWVGEWAALARKDGPEGRGQLDFTGPEPFRFVRGCLAEVTVGELTAACARALVRAPQLRLLRRLFVGGFAYEEDEEDESGDVPAGTDEPAEQILLRWPQLAHLRTFQLGWTSDEDYGDFCHFQCHQGGRHAHEFVRQMPRLEELSLFVHRVDADRLFALPLPNLRALQLYHSHSYPLAKLARNASLTRLTHLLCHPHALEADRAFIRQDGLRAVVRSPHLKGLTHLRLRLTDFGDEGCREIVRSGILGRLEVLDLRHGRVSDEGARVLAACPDLKRLKQLDLSRNELTEEGVAVLNAVGIPVRTEHQHESTEDINPDEEAYEMQFLFEGDYE
jgi:uncharacterized protein (TIGR02996 family)